MLDLNREGLGTSFGRTSAEEVFTPPSGYTGVRNGVVNGVGIRKSKDTISEEGVRDQLSRILESSTFVQSDRLGRFLRFTVERTLGGEEEMLKEYLIGTEVYDRPTSYHPSEDSIVRSEARRLRSKLKEYYESVGKDDPVFIHYRLGSYVPVFQPRLSHDGDGNGKNVAPGKRFIDERGIRVAVLPFVIASESELSSASAQIITDELIHELVCTDGFRVTAASSVAPLLAQALDTPSLARKLDVQIVFEGTVREHDKLLRIMFRVVNAADGFQIWSERFETEPNLQALFKAAERIVSALVSRFRPNQSLIRKQRTNRQASQLRRPLASANTRERRIARTEQGLDRRLSGTNLGTRTGAGLAEFNLR